MCPIAPRLTPEAEKVKQSGEAETQGDKGTTMFTEVQCTIPSIIASTSLNARQSQRNTKSISMGSVPGYEIGDPPKSKNG